MAEHGWQSPRVVAAACAAAIAIGAAGALLPAALRDTTATSGTPVRRDAVAHDVALAAGQRVCVGSVALDRDSAVARLWIRQVAARGARLRVIASAAGSRAAGTAVLAPQPSRNDPPALDVRLAPPPRAAIGSVCVASTAGEVTLVGSDHPRAVVRSHATLDGAPLAQAPSLTLLEGARRSPLARTSELIDRAAALSPFGPWLFWALIPLLLLVLPALVVTALQRALAADARDAEPPPRA